MNILILQHIGCEPAAAYEDELRDRGARLHAVRLYRGEALPKWTDFDGIVAMGGPMSANDDDRFSWLTAEKALIADAVHHGMPYWGVCLGAQLLAASLGARVFAGPEPEVGVLTVQETATAGDDPVFGVLPAEFATLQWHGDTYELPDGATQLARSRAFEQQAFVYRRAYGLQFHLEVDAQLACSWADVPEYRSSLEDVQGPGALERLVEQIRAHERTTTALGRRALAAWIDRVVRPGRGSDTVNEQRTQEIR